MKYLKKDYLIPNDELISSIDLASSRLHKKLVSLDISSLNISDYNKKYLKTHLDKLQISLEISSYILAWALHKSKIPLKNFVILEYGAGTGIISLLAKELGLKVIYNDIYEVSCKDAKIISDQIGNMIDHFVKGDIDDVIKYLQSNNLQCNSIVSSDVIEHIYDVDSFFHKVCLLSNNLNTVVMVTAANPFHPLIRKKLVHIQSDLEFKDRKYEFGHKERDTLRAYSTIRREIIKDYLYGKKIESTNKEIEKLVISTRGMIKKDIQKCVQNFAEKKILPKKDQFPSNTCDPYTGNWAEHLMNPFYLKKILEDENFETFVLNGFMSKPKGMMKKIIVKLMNKIILHNLLGKNTIKLAPFYTIYARKNFKN